MYVTRLSVPPAGQQHAFSRLRGGGGALSVRQKCRTQCCGRCSRHSGTARGGHGIHRQLSAHAHRLGTYLLGWRWGHVWGKRKALHTASRCAQCLGTNKAWHGTAGAQWEMYNGAQARPASTRDPSWLCKLANGGPSGPQASPAGAAAPCRTCLPGSTRAKFRYVCIHGPRQHLPMNMAGRKYGCTPSR